MVLALNVYTMQSFSEGKNDITEGGFPQAAEGGAEKRSEMEIKSFFSDLKRKFKKRPAPGTSRSIFIRMKALAFIMAILAVAVMGQLARYQLIDNEEYQKKAINQQLRDTPIPAKRGTVYDSNMEMLIQSTTAWKVTINTITLNDVKGDDYNKRRAIVQKLADVLDLSEEYIEGRITEFDHSVEVQLKNKADKKQHDDILRFLEDNEIKCVRMLTDTRRVFSRGTLASTVMGFTGADNIGITGVELQYNTELSGIDGREVRAKNAQNGSMPSEDDYLIEPQDGNSIVLTIDANCQAILEKYLGQAVIENKINNRACGILMDVNTGAIKAMATMPDYDPADFNTVQDASAMAEIERLREAGDESWETELHAARWAQYRNKAISDTYEPGSLFKPVTMAAALEEGVTNLGDSFYCPGYRVVGGIRRNCHKTSGHGAESLTQAMMNSCNPVFMTLGERLGGTGFYKYFQAFGFTSKTGIDLPDEAVGIFFSEKGLNGNAVDLAAVSFGQANTVTPIQMVTAISAISNGGYLVQPHVVEQIIDNKGNVISNTETNIKRQVISSQTSDIINGMLEKVVSSGTAKNGYIAGYRIGGKTGTSERLSYMADTGRKTYVASFCAIAPSDDPELALLIVLDDPRGDLHMGGTIAAPVARNVLKDVLPYLGVETIYSSADMAVLDIKTPTLVNHTVEEAKQIAEEKGIKLRVLGEGEEIINQMPPAGQNIQKNGTVIVSTYEDGDVPMTTVPNVVGDSASEANSEIIGRKLNIIYSGTGYDSSQGVAVSQSIPPETEVEQGTVVSVEFIMSGATD